MISIVIPVKDALDVTRRCVAELFRHTKTPIELILVDNGSRADFAEFASGLARARPEVRVITNARNEGFAFAVNQGLAAARGEHVVVMNNDVLVTDGWLERMLAVFGADPRVGVVGPTSNRASGPQEIPVAYDVENPGEDLAAFAREHARTHAGQVQFLSRIVGLCVLVKRAVIDAIGGFDTRFWPGNFEDDDFSLRALRAGFRLAVARDVFVHHHGSKTFADLGIDYARVMHDNWRHFCAKWEHVGALGPYPARALATRRPFDAERDFVPLDARETFRPDATPLPLDGTHATRFLVIADVVDRGWLNRVAEFVREFRASDPVSLVVRIEPPTREVIELTTSLLREAIARTGVPDADLPDVLIDASTIAARRRGGLYTSADALLDTGEKTLRAPLWRREATACGIEVLAPGRLRERAELTPSAR